MTVGELLKKISSSEITEWMAYYSLEAGNNQPKEQDAKEALTGMFKNRIVKKGK
jgi:hypothetical protein